MQPDQEPDRLLRLLSRTMSALVASDTADLTSRQSAILMTCFLEARPQTVRGLSFLLRISKPAVSRALDRLSDLGMARRLPDAADGRSVLVEITRRGRDHLEFVKSVMAENGASAGTAPPALLAA